MTIRAPAPLTTPVRKIIVASAVAVGITGIVLSSIMANLILLGPSGAVLPDDPLATRAVWYRFADLDPGYDYYAFVVVLVNQATTDSVSPYRVEVNLTVIGGESLGGWLPAAGDYPTMQDVPMDLGDALLGGTIRLPAGDVRVDIQPTYILWTVAGQRGLVNQPVFASKVNFYGEFRLPENATLEAHPEALVEWYYANPLQSYSVGVRGAHAVCYQPAPTGMEGNASFGFCL